MEDRCNTGDTKYVLANGQEISEGEYLDLMQDKNQETEKENEALPKGGKEK
jgi:hypothetical protein